VDADNHFVTEFTHDGKTRLLTLGTPGVPGTDDTHFSRPTFMAFMDANTWYLADGYDGTRVIKYDMKGKKLLQWGMKGTPPNERRPGYFNSVHGIAVDPTTRRVYVNDRNNGRVQVFDENGKFLDQWDFGPRPPMNIHSIYMGANHILWAADQGSNKLLAYDAGGHFLYSWGTFAPARAACGACTGSRPTRRQSLHRRSENRPSPEVHAAPGRQPPSFSWASRGRACGRRSAATEGSRKMSLSGFVRFRCTPLIVIVWVALQASSAHGQQRGGTPQTDKVQPVNSGANPYRVIRNWAQAPEGREWGGSNGVAIDRDGRSVWATDPVLRQEPRPAVLAPKRTLSTNSTSQGRRFKSFGGADVRLAAWHPCRSRRKCLGDGRASPEPGRPQTSFPGKKTREAWSSSSAPKARSS